METPFYEKVIIRTEDDLPKEEGDYVCKVCGNDKIYVFDETVIRSYALSIDWYLRPLPQPERKTAEEMTEDKMDLIQYVTNLLYFARNETSEFANIEFDRWVEDQTTNLREYAAQGIASENTIPYIKSEHDHQLPRIAKIIGKDKFVFEQSINALLYIIETQGIDWPSEEPIKETLIKFLCSLDEETFYSDRPAGEIVDEWLLNRVKQGKEVSNEPEPCKSCKNKAPENCSTCKVINGHLDGV